MHCEHVCHCWQVSIHLNGYSFLPLHLFDCHSIFFIDTSPILHKSFITPQWMQLLIQSDSPAWFAAIRASAKWNSRSLAITPSAQNKFQTPCTSKQTGEPISKLLFFQRSSNKPSNQLCECDCREQQVWNLWKSCVLNTCRKKKELTCSCWWLCSTSLFLSVSLCRFFLCSFALAILAHLSPSLARLPIAPYSSPLPVSPSCASRGHILYF